MLLEALLVAAMTCGPVSAEATMPDESSLSEHLGRGRRRKLRNLSAFITQGGSASTGGPVEDDDPTDPVADEPGGGGTDDCGGGLLPCEEFAAAEVCIPSGSGAAEKQVGCVLDVLDAQLEEGDTVAWGADLKCTTANEVSPDGMLKLTDPGLLVRDALDTLDNITIEAGTVEIESGKLRCAADGQWRYTGIGARSEIVVQVRKRSSDFQDHHFVGRLNASLNGYSVQQNRFEDTMWEILGAAENGQLGSDPDGAGKADNHLDVMKIHVKDGQQRGRIGSTVSDQTYDFTAADTDRDGETGTFGAVPDPTAPAQTTYWDAIACPSDEITCSALPTGHSIRVGDLSATESAGTATLDLEGTLYPAAYPLEVLDASGDPVTAWSPPSGIFGGATFEFSSGGAFSADDAAAQIDLDIFDSSGTLLSTETTGSTWDEPTYQRQSGTVSLPVGARFLAPTLRRTGTDTAVVCSRRVVVRAGVSAPWVPCDEDVTETAAGRCGQTPVILNREWLDNGAYWATHPDNTGSARFTSLTIGNIEFDFPSNGDFVFFYQVDSSNTDIDKATEAAVPIEPIRYLKVCPDDVLKIAAEFVKENPGDGTDFELTIWEWDANKEQVGTAHSGVLQWVASETGGRKQLTYSIGERTTDENREQVRYVSFGGQASGDAGETSGLLYLVGWRNVADFHASAVITTDGANADFQWRSMIGARMKYEINTTGFVDYADIEASGTWSPAGSALETTQLIEDALTGLSSGDVIYLTMVPYDRDSFRRNGKIVHVMHIVP